MATIILNPNEYIAIQLRDLAARIEREGVENASVSLDERSEYKPKDRLGPSVQRHYDLVSISLEIPIKATTKAKRPRLPVKGSGATTSPKQRRGPR